MLKTKDTLLVAVFAVGGLCVAPASYGALFLDDFESYSNGQIVYTEGGGSGAPVYDSGISQSSFGPGGHTKGMLPGNTGAALARLSTSLSQPVAGDYRLQWDAAQIFNAGGVGQTNNQLGFIRWGGNTNILLSAVSQTGDGNTTYDLKYYDGATYVDTGIDLLDDIWYRFRLEWNTTNTTTQRLYVDGVEVFNGQLLYGTIANPTSLSFVQWVANTYAFGVDNVAFDTGTGAIAIPEPASVGLLTLAGILIAGRRRRS